jgi:hypothetical protein
MAVGTGTLTVSISESVTLGGKRYGNSVTETVASINDVYERIITCPTSEITLYTTHASAVAGAQFDEDLVQYVRITNHDAGNFIQLLLTDANSDEFSYRLDAGKSFIIWNHKTSMSAEEAAGAGAPDADIVSVKATADSGACDLEIMVAST